jgi:long-chain fatty acid transport protein
MREALGIGAALVCSFASSIAAASPQDVLGYGARSAAMGGTGVASAEGYEAVYKNPALL